MFVKASRLKLRFVTTKGNISTEDLWDLSPVALDTIYKNLRKQQKASDEESLLDKKTSADEELDLKVDIVKFVFNTKIEEKEARERAAELSAKKRKLIELIAQKKEEADSAKSIDELEKELAKLG